MTSTVYSPLKVFHHQDRLQQLREGKQPLPCQVQLIISDLCNQSCSFCLVAGTGILTPTGEVPIESLKVGDVVTAPDGGINIVTETSERKASSYFVLEAGSRRICVTGEHPILTATGFKKANEILEGETAVVRMRVRRSSKRGSREDLELVHSQPSAFREIVQERSSKDFQADERKQPYVLSRDRSQGLCKDEGGLSQAWSQLERECFEGSPQENALQFQPNEESGDCEEGEYTSDVSENSFQNRGAVHQLVGGIGISNRVHRECQDLGRSPQPRLSSERSEEGTRIDSMYDVQRLESNSSFSGGLWAGIDSTLQSQGLEMLGGICAGPETSSQRTTGKDHQRLCISGIELERGLELQRVTKVERVVEEATVYNFSCDRIQAYEANGIIVHNCAYRSDGYSSNQLFTAGAKLASFGHNNPIRRIEYSKVVEILDDCKELGIQAIQLTGGGEPTAHPQFSQILKDVLDRGLDLALVTNGVILKEPDLANLTKCSWVRFSIDAGTQETYCRVRSVGPHHWDQVWKNLEALCALRVQSVPKSQLVVGVGFVVTKDNYQEVFTAAKLAKQAGANNIRISAVFQDEGPAYFKDIFEETKRQCLAAKSLENDHFKVFDLFGERLDDLTQQSPDYSFCGIQHFVTYIGGDLNVYRCCVLAYNEQGKIGSLKEQRFKDLWRSLAKQDDFRTFDARACPKCMFNTKNRTILYALEPNPQHVNFV